MADSLLKEDGGHLLQENGSLILLDEIAPPSAPTLVKGTRTNNLPTGLSGSTVIATIPYLYLTWPATSLGADFAYYEVQRVDGDGANTVAFITNESAPRFADFETRRGEVVNYQIRVGHVGGTLSAFVSTASGLSVSATNDCEVDLVSNGNPKECLALYDGTPITFNRSTASEVVMVPIEGRDTPQGFISAEKGGDIFVRTFLIAFNDPGIKQALIKKGRAIFKAIVTLLEDSALPGITCLDSYGDRWYTTPRIGNMVWLEPVGSYKVDVTFNESAPPAAPPFIVTANPWQPSYG